MLSFADRSTLSALTNLVEEKENLGAAEVGPWERTSSDKSSLEDRLDRLATLAGVMDEFFSTDPDVVRSSVEGEPSSLIRDPSDDVEHTVTGYLGS